MGSHKRTCGFRRDSACFSTSHSRELPLDTQGMLLCFLEGGEVRPLGSAETMRVDVRLISATHRNLKAAVQQGALRDDLRYRLRRGVLRVPPLRDRRDDIPLFQVTS